MDLVVDIAGWTTLGLLALWLLFALVSPFIDAWADRFDERQERLAAGLRMAAGDDQ